MNRFIRQCLLLLGLFIALGTSAQVSNDVILGLEKGNAAQVSKYFNSNVELYINEKDNVYSQAQAKLILEDFFAAEQVKSFSIIHQSARDKSRYTIGKLTGSNNNYRISFLEKTVGGTSLIYQLRIEKQ